MHKREILMYFEGAKGDDFIVKLCTNDKYVCMNATSYLHIYFYVYFHILAHS